MAVNIFPNDDWQTKINAASAGETFIVKLGVHLKARNLSPKDNQKFLGEIGSGGETPIVDLEFQQDARFMATSKTGIVLQDLEIRHFFLTALQRGVVDFNPSGSAVSNNCQCIRLYIHHGVGQGITVGHGGLVDECEVHNCFMAFAGGGNNCEVKNSWWHDLNNPDSVLQPWYQKMVDEQLGKWQKLTTISGGQWIVQVGFTSGFKFATTDGAKIHHNEVGPNVRGGGIWLDIRNINYDIYENYLHDNPNGGIHIEVSYGGKVHHNLVERVKVGDTGPGRFGILISESPGTASIPVQVFANTVRNCGGGIGMRQSTNRFNQTLDGTNFKRCMYVQIMSNIIEHCDVLAGATSGSGELILTDKATFHNEYDFNAYRAQPDNGQHFTQNRTWTDWQNIPQDPNGSFNATAPPTERHGSCTIPITFGVNAEGRKRGKGSSSVSVGLVVEAHGAGVLTPAPKGESVVPLAFDVTADGTPAKHGAPAPIGVAFVVSALGHKEPVPPPPVGTSTVGVSFAVTARGRKRAKGSATIPITFAVEPEPSAVKHGDSGVAVGFAVTASGHKNAHSSQFDEFGDPIPIEVGVSFGIFATGNSEPTPNDRHGSCTIPLQFTVIPTDEEGEDPDPPAGTPGKFGNTSVGVAFAVNASGHGATPGGGGGPPPPPGGQTAAILPEEYRTEESRMSQEGFS